METYEAFRRRCVLVDGTFKADYKRMGQQQRTEKEWMHRRIGQDDAKFRLISDFYPLIKFEQTRPRGPKTKTTQRFIRCPTAKTSQFGLSNRHTIEMDHSVTWEKDSASGNWIMYVLIRGMIDKKVNQRLADHDEMTRTNEVFPGTADWAWRYTGAPRNPPRKLDHVLSLTRSELISEGNGA